MNPAEIRFAADGMLRSLATWLRLLGYDCLAGREWFGRRLFEQALAEHRVFLTRNAHLAENLPHALLERGQIGTIAGEHLPEQLREVVSRFSLETEHAVFSRCLECNETLQLVRREEVIDAVPVEVAVRESEFYRCAHCGKTFWRGSHVRDSLQRLQGWLKD